MATELEEKWNASKPEHAPYWGIDTVTGKTVAGTSSGLSENAAKRICELHNADLEARNEPPEA